MTTHPNDRRHAAWRLVAALALIALAVSACSSDDSSSDDSESETDGMSAEESNLTGEPATVWVIEDSSEESGITFPGVRAGIDARVNRINSDGGLGGSGRPVEVMVCETNFDANQAAQCARDAVADESTIAVAASVSANGDAVLPILEEAGVANIGSTAFAQADSTSPVSFPTMGGLIAATGCQATVLRDEAGAEAIGVVRSDTPGADQTGPLLTALGVEPAAEVVTPVANTDYSAELGAIASEADALLLAQDGATALRTVRNIGELGLDQPVSGSGGQDWTPDAIADAGDATEDMYLALWYATDDTDAPGVQQYLDDMEAVDGLGSSADLSKLGWVAFELLDQVAAGTETIDRTTVLDGLNSTTAFDSGGLTPVIDYTQPGPLLGGVAPRYVNDSCVYAQVQDGEIVGISDGFLTPFTEG